MKHQQVVVDYWSMIKTSFTCLLLAFSGYVLIKMVQTIFWLPGHLKQNQKRLEDLAAQYKIDLTKLDEESLMNEVNLEKLENPENLENSENAEKALKAEEAKAIDQETKKDL